MKKLENKQLDQRFELLNVDLGDILEETANLQEYKSKIERKNKSPLSLEELVNLQISLDHIHSHCREGAKIIEKLLDDLDNGTL